MAVDLTYLTGGLDTAMEKPTMNYRRFVALYLAVAATIGVPQQTAWLAEMNAKFGPEVETPSGFRKLPLSMQERVLVYGRCKMLEQRYVANVGPLPVYTANKYLLSYNNSGDSFRLHPQKLIDAIAYACEILDIESRGLALAAWNALASTSLQMPNTAERLLQAWDSRLAPVMIAMARIFGSAYQSVVGLGNYELDINPQTPIRLRDADYASFIQMGSWLAEGAYWGGINFTDQMDILSQENYGTTSMDALVAEMVSLFRRGRIGINDMRRYLPHAEIVAYGYVPEIVVQLLDHLVKDKANLTAANVIYLGFPGGLTPNVTPAQGSLILKVPAGFPIDTVDFYLEYEQPAAGIVIDATNPVVTDADVFTITSSLVGTKRRWKFSATKAAKWLAGGSYQIGTFDFEVPAGQKYGSAPQITMVPNEAITILNDGATLHAQDFLKLGMRAKTGIKSDQSQNIQFPVQAPLFPIPPL